MPPADDDLSLNRRSLVSKSWLKLSRRRLFSKIYTETKGYQSWLARKYCSLTYSLEDPFMLSYDHGGPCLGVYDLRDYFPSFHQPRALTVCCMDIEPTIVDDLDIFTAFQRTLSLLTLMQVWITRSSFVALTGYFPDLRLLDIRGSIFEVDSGPIPQPPYIPRSDVIEPFIDCLPALKQEYDELVIVGAYNHRLAAAIGAGLKHLKIEERERTSPSSCLGPRH